MAIAYGSVCSGIEAASVAWSPLGWQCRFVSEIDKFPCAVLKHRFPSVPNYGDMTKYTEWPDEQIDVLVRRPHVVVRDHRHAAQAAGFLGVRRTAGR